jgi:hypothetical protein
MTYSLLLTLSLTYALSRYSKLTISSYKVEKFSILRCSELDVHSRTSSSRLKVIVRVRGGIDVRPWMSPGQFLMPALLYVLSFDKYRCTVIIATKLRVSSWRE